MKKLLAAALVVALGAGCASIIKGGGSQAVSIRSTPSEAHFKITDLKTGAVIVDSKTPNIVALNKSHGYFSGGHYQLTVEKPGFDTRMVDIDSNVNGWYVAGNLVFGGLIGWLLVDPATGAMWNLSAEELNVDLPASKGGVAAVAVEPTFKPDLTPAFVPAAASQR